MSFTEHEYLDKLRVAIGNSLSVLGFYNLCKNEIKDILKEPRQQENNQQNGGILHGLNSQKSEDKEDRTTEVVVHQEEGMYSDMIQNSLEM